MTTTKLQAVGSRPVRDKKGKVFFVTSLKHVEKLRPCKICKRNPRQSGSSRCKKCVQAAMEMRLMNAKINNLRK